MSGAARTIVDDDVHKSFAQYVLNVHSATGLFNNGPDLYMYVRTGDTMKEA